MSTAPGNPGAYFISASSSLKPPAVVPTGSVEA